MVPNVAQATVDDQKQPLPYIFCMLMVYFVSFALWERI